MQYCRFVQVVVGCGLQSREEKKIQAFMKLFEKMEKSELSGRVVASSHTGKKERTRKHSIEKEDEEAAATSSVSVDHDDHPVTDRSLPSPAVEKMEKSESGGRVVASSRPGKKERTRKYSMDKEDVDEAAATSSISVDHDDQPVTGRYLPSPAVEKMEKSESSGRVVASSRTAKKERTRKHSMEKEDEEAAAVTSVSVDHDDWPVTDRSLPSPAVDSELTELCTDEVKCDDARSPAVDTKLVTDSCTVDDIVKEESRTDTAAANDLPLLGDLTPCDLSESGLPQIKSPAKPTVQPDVSDTVLPDVKPVDLHTPLIDKPKPMVDEAVQCRVELPEAVLVLTRLESESSYEEKASGSVTDQPEHVTAGTSEADIGTEAVATTKKTVVTLQTNRRPVKGTAKLKFGVYARKPLASWTWMKADEHETESSSSSDDDDDMTERSTVEPDTAVPPPPPAAATTPPKSNQVSSSDVFACLQYF